MIYIVQIAQNPQKVEKWNIELDSYDVINTIYDDDNNEISLEDFMEKVWGIWRSMPVSGWGSTDAGGFLNQLRKDCIEGMQDDNIWLLGVKR